MIEVVNYYKDNLYKFLDLFEKKFPYVDITNRLMDLKTLKIRAKKDMTKNMEYDYINNVINISTKYLLIDDHLFMHTLIEMLSTNDLKTKTGLSCPGYILLNQGITELITNYVVPPKNKNYYIDEVVISNLIAHIIGGEKLIKYYFSNDTVGFINELKMVLKDELGLMKIISKMNQNKEDIRKKQNKSLLKDIIEELTVLYEKSNPSDYKLEKYNLIVSKYIDSLSQVPMYGNLGELLTKNKAFL